MGRVLTASLLAMLVSLVAVERSAAQHPSSQSCPARFDAAVTSGPDAGMKIGGELDLTVVPSGRAHGSLTLDDGRRVSVTGDVEGPDISLRLNRLHISGTGTTVGDFSACTGHSEGVLFGPRRDDTGDWGIIWGS